MRALFLVAIIFVSSVFSTAYADQGYPYPDMQVHRTAKSFDALVADLKAAVTAKGMGLVSQACGSCGAKAQGFDIPGNYVAGVFRNDFARRLFALHVPAGIEAPIRFYVTESADGTAVLTYRQPSAIFGAYGVEGLAALGAELDAIFAAIADMAVQP